MLRFLLTNDDGIDATGLAVLKSALRGFGSVLTVAPNRAYSDCGHCVSTRGGILVEEVDRETLAVWGSPADCVRIALTQIDSKVDFVLSGINHGANLGADLAISGTVAAAREAAFLGYRAIACSQYVPPDGRIDWAQAGASIKRVLADLLERGAQSGRFWNVNLPAASAGGDPRPVVECPVDPSPLQIAYALREGAYEYIGEFHARPRRNGHDVEACLNGAITISLASVV